jgi:hypothetical protein
LQDLHASLLRDILHLGIEVEGYTITMTKIYIAFANLHDSEVVLSVA